jgi:hypothetical protein
MTSFEQPVGGVPSFAAQASPVAAPSGADACGRPASDNDASTAVCIPGRARISTSLCAQSTPRATLRFIELLRRSLGMTDRREIRPTADRADVLAGFHAEVGRLMSLSREAFAAVDPDVMRPLVATIRVTSSKVSIS